MKRGRYILSLLLTFSLMLAPLQSVWAGAFSAAEKHGMTQQKDAHHCGHQAKSAPDCCKQHQAGGCDQMGLDCQAHCASILLGVIIQIPPLALARKTQTSDSDYRIHHSGYRPELEQRPPITA